MKGSTDMTVLMHISSIFFQIYSSLIPCALRAFLKAYNDHFEPYPSSFSVLVLIKLIFFLFTLKFVKCMNFLTFLEAVLLVLEYLHVANLVNPSS